MYLPSFVFRYFGKQLAYFATDQTIISNSSVSMLLFDCDWELRVCVCFFGIVVVCLSFHADFWCCTSCAYNTTVPFCDNVAMFTACVLVVNASFGADRVPSCIDEREGRMRDNILVIIG